jgi:GT2 family glycosyltransferase
VRGVHHAGFDFDEFPPDAGLWRRLVAEGQPVVHVERIAVGEPRSPSAAPVVVVTGFAYCTQGLTTLALVVDGRPRGEPFHGLYRPDLADALGNHATVASGFRGELPGIDETDGDRELLAVAVAPDGRATGWRGPLRATPTAAAPAVPLPPLQPPPRLRSEEESLAGAPPRGRHRWQRLAEHWAERALRLEYEREAAETDLAWSGLQTRKALERAAENELARRAEAARGAKPRQSIVFPEAPEPLVSVVVTVHHGDELTRRCLEALATTAGETPFEVVVVDDGDDPEVAGLLATVRGATVIRNTTNLGYLRSANVGARAARGAHIALLNNDTEPHHGWLDALVGRLRADEKTGVVAAKLLFPDGRLQEAGGIVWSDGSGFNYGWGEDETADPYNVVRDVDYASAAAMLIRGSLWRELGGFDERFRPAYYEDADLCFAARARGLRAVYEPAARVVHVLGGSMGADTRRLIEANRSTFVSKWAAALADHFPYDPERVHAAANRGAHARPGS